MADILKADRKSDLNGVRINEYFLTEHNLNNIDMPSESMDGRVIGVTIHNTDRITTAEGTTPAEQYTRATVNGNMNDVRVHFYCDDVCAWQNLPLTLSGWHSADGDGDGNRRTVSVECIMSKDYDEKDRKSEDNCARIAAALLKQYSLGTDALFTHSHWYSGKTCPVYILPHWEEFRAEVQKYLDADNVKQLYRVRKSWDDVRSQTGAYAVYDNAVKACGEGYSVFDENGNVMYSWKKAIDLIAVEVIQGRWGNGADRKARLTAEGYDPDEVQEKVNELLG